MFSTGLDGFHRGSQLGIFGEALPGPLSTSTSCRASSATAPAFTTSSAGPCASCRASVDD
jgi:hypothetical protein